MKAFKKINFVHLVITFDLEKITRDIVSAVRCVRIKERIEKFFVE